MDEMQTSSSFRPREYTSEEGRGGEEDAPYHPHHEGEQEPRGFGDDEEGQIENSSWIFDVSSGMQSGGKHKQCLLPPGEYFIGDLTQVLDSSDLLEVQGDEHSGCYALKDGTTFYMFELEPGKYQGAVNMTGMKNESQPIEIHVNERFIGCLDARHIDGDKYAAHPASGVVVEYENEFTPERDRNVVRFGSHTTLFLNKKGEQQYLDDE
jgi:hypothetical protein